MRVPVLALLLLMVPILCTADEVFIPAAFAEVGGEEIQEFAVDHAQRFCEGNVLFANPVDACIVRVNDTLEISVFVDDVWNKIVYVTSIIDDDGVRRSNWFLSYARPDWTPTAVTFDPLFLSTTVDTGGLSPVPCRVWPVFVADSENDRIAELGLCLLETLDMPPWFFLYRYIGDGFLSRPSDVSFCDSWGYLYIVHNGPTPVVAYDTRLQHGTTPQLDLRFGRRGSAVCAFSNPVAIECDALAGTWPQYVYVCDSENARVVCLARATPYDSDVGWHSYYTEPGFDPVSVASSLGCGVYVLNRGVTGPEVVVLDRELTHKLATYTNENLLHPRCVYVRESEAGIINEYTQSTGLAYYVLDAKVENLSASPNPFDPLETHTLISYTLSGYGHVTARVYDTSWQLKRALVDSIMTSAGGHWEWWDGRDDSDSLLALGTYHAVISVWDVGGDGLPDRDTVDVSIAGVPLTILTTDLSVRDPSWSNDGSKIAFASAEFGGLSNGIWVCDADGEDLTRLTNSGTTQYDGHPDWSPNDSFLVFQRSQSIALRSSSRAAVLRPGLTDLIVPGPLDVGISRVYRIRANGSDLTQLTDSIESGDWHPSWSPYLTNENGATPSCGGRIAVWRYADHQLWTFKATDGSDRRMVTGGGESIGNCRLPDRGYPAWSPDGQQIAFETQPMDSLTDSLGIWRIDVETGAYAAVVCERPWGDVNGVSWSPDGQAIAYEIADSDSLATGIKVVSAGGLFDMGYVVKNKYGSGIDWSPDGTKLAFVVESGWYPSLAIVDFKRDASAFPSANIIRPLSGTTRTGGIVVLGYAEDNVGVDGHTVLSHLQSLSLEWGLGSDPLLWFTDGITLISGEPGLLGTWATSQLDEGTYTLRLSVTDGTDTNVDRVYLRVCGQTASADDIADIPSDFEISKPSPSPFSGVTRFRVGAPRCTDVVLNVYNCEGRLVRRILDGPMEPGWIDACWDGRNSAGCACSQGVYWFRFSSGDVSRVARVVLLR